MSGRLTHENSTTDDGDDISTIKGNDGPGDLAFSDEEDANEEWLKQGDYSSNLKDILSDEEESEYGEFHYSGKDDGEEDADDFVYSGRDADTTGASYEEQLRDILEEDMDSEDELQHNSAAAGETSFASHSNQADITFEVSSPHRDVLSDHSVTGSSDVPPITPPSRVQSPALSSSTPARPQRPAFLHPGVSRLRSGVTGSGSQQSRTVSASSFAFDRNVASPSPSFFSGPSRTSSSSNLNASFSRAEKEKHTEPQSFRWASLKVVGDYLFPKAPSKANSLLGASLYGSPTVLAANGLICVGTDKGQVLVFDFKQSLICVCGDENSEKFGPVSALALSHDHTFVGVGHIHGHIQLFDFKSPHTPARTVIPTSIAAVASGRQEGHIYGSRILALGFIAGRHTAIVSSDDQGLAFYHSLGKVLFVDATDVLRILGKYPEEDILPTSAPSKKRPNGSSRNSQSAVDPIPPALTPVRSTQRKANTILSMAHLPLGTSEHGTDTYQLIAMITPIKLVIVGLKPSPKTWFRRHREGEEDEGKNSSKFRGCLAWFPSVTTQGTLPQNGDSAKQSKKGQKVQAPVTDPVLAFCWGRSLAFLRTFETRTLVNVTNKKTGRNEKVETGKVNFEEIGTFIFDSDVLSIQWTNANQIIAFRDACLDVLDIRTLVIVETVSFDASRLLSPSSIHESGGAGLIVEDASKDVQHSIKSYKGKLFALEKDGVKVGTLLSWADKILSFVQEGDFINAISLSRDYYLGNAKGNKNGLPEDTSALRSVVGEKMSELMVASARYAFSEDRLTDTTHITPDNRGVDRTSLFEDLVSTCARACIALDEFDFLFEELFSWYDNTGIANIYLRQLEPFVLDNSISFVPPRITKRLIAMHESDGRLDEAERIIWHIDPACLDIDQAVTLCERYRLLEALIYVHNTALQDYTTPLVLLIGFVRKMQQRRREAERANELNESLTFDTREDESMTRNAYRVYSYLGTLLSGQTYPSEMPMSPTDAQKAMDDIYGLLFYGRSKVWPTGDTGQLVLTADEEGGPEPTYPYTRLLLRFDAEAFLHTLDVAFENSYLNESQGISRQMIIKIFMDIIASADDILSSADSTFVRIFIARNVPKYPQFIQISPTALQSLLVGLASDSDQSTREDRQLAAEFLLSVYTPRDSDQIMKLFEDAAFYRILRTWYHSEKQWASLLQTYTRDPAIQADELFSSIESTLADSSRLRKGSPPQDIVSALMDSVPQLLDTSIPLTALLVDKFLPERHSVILDELPEEATYKKYVYLRCLLGPPEQVEEGTSSESCRPSGSTVSSIDVRLRSLYLELLCQYDSERIVKAIEYLPQNFLPADEIASICEAAKAYDAVVWILSNSSALKALTSLESFSRNMIASVTGMFASGDEDASGLQTILRDMRSLYERGIIVCRETSDKEIAAEVPIEDCWFKLLSTQIDAIQTISQTASDEDKDALSSARDDALVTLRSILQDSFTSLVSVSSTKAVSFPRLFKRLVDSSSQSRLTSGTPYDEFRSILMSMLESYRSEGDLLVMTKRILDNDVFDAMEELTRERGMGWRPFSNRCATCRRQLRAVASQKVGEDINDSVTSLAVSRTGLIYHTACFPAASLEAR